MRWFRKDRPLEVWETDVQPAGNIAAAQRIREICIAAGAMAGRVATLQGRKAETEKGAEAERYQAAIKCALEIAMKMSDDAVRDVSVSQIIRLCVKANHLKTAKVLLRAIQSGGTRAELIMENPVLTDQDAAS
ncbi:hypothetical protein CQ13_10410 [Bradyrhizobium retamae]|uniref:Uncharacterized protein n=2 Tax=Bradyrhizobium retamae TaxID=1300035 RepID=A0A0R3MLL3_9BRAD|nr:hypothetical protein CQ13_10410 [Bradyrhizobium retamae]